MAAITVQNMKGPFDVISAGNLTPTWTAGNTGGDTFAVTGREIILIWNSGASPYTVTITSQVDEKNRTRDITTYSLAAGEVAYFTGGLTNSAGWKDTNGLINITPSNVAVKWAFLKLPAGYPG